MSMALTVIACVLGGLIALIMIVYLILFTLSAKILKKASDEIAKGFKGGRW